ncbi:MAG: methyl-coenzyme M reductase subunit gamma, partial [ANME-2 cluster archaeon]|nr:methyl-coenzyme M reductase subunit gamma [ANME-2 cluster archaeon]
RRLEGGNIVQDKDQVGVPIDRKVNMGKPMSSDEASKRTTFYRVGNVAFRDDAEVVEWTQRIWELRSVYGYQPK